MFHLACQSYSFPLLWDQGLYMDWFVCYKLERLSLSKPQKTYKLEPFYINAWKVKNITSDKLSHLEPLKIWISFLSLFFHELNMKVLKILYWQKSKLQIPTVNFVYRFVQRYYPSSWKLRYLHKNLSVSNFNLASWARNSYKYCFYTRSYMKFETKLIATNWRQMIFVKHNIILISCLRHQISCHFKICFADLNTFVW